MRDRIKQLLQEFKIDELSRVEYKDGEIVMEYIEGYDYPRYVLYYDSPQMISIPIVLVQKKDSLHLL